MDDDPFGDLNLYETNDDQNLDNTNDDSFVPEEPTSASPENSDAEQSTNNRPRNASSPSAEDRAGDMISLSTGGVDDAPGIMGAGEEAEEVDSHSAVDNAVSGTGIFPLLIETIY